MLKIGLTGGIGSGKTTVANLFEELGAAVIDMDVLAREVVRPGETALREIKTVFGDDICNENDELDRRRLREIIFADAGRRRQLEDIIHPRIRQRLDGIISRLNEPYCIIVIPLLFETGRGDSVDRILVVDSTIEEQIRRAMQRDNISEDHARKIMASQVDRQTRLENADDVITNSGKISELKSRVEQLHRKYLDLAHND